MFLWFTESGEPHCLGICYVMSDFVWNILSYIHGLEPSVHSWHKWRPRIVNSSQIFPVFKLLRVYKHHLSHVHVTCSRICRWFLDFLKIRGLLCQYNVGIYVYSAMQLKETLVDSSTWMGWCNFEYLWSWCDVCGEWVVDYAVVVHCVNGHT